MIAILFDSVDDCSHACLTVLSGSTRPVISDLCGGFCCTEDRGLLDRIGLAWIKARLTGSRASRSNAAHLADTVRTQRPTSACLACLHKFNTLYPPPPSTNPPPPLLRTKHPSHYESLTEAQSVVPVDLQIDGRLQERRHCGRQAVDDAGSPQPLRAYRREG